MNTPADPSGQPDPSDTADSSDQSDQPAGSSASSGPSPAPDLPTGPRIGHALLVSFLFYIAVFAVAIPMGVYYALSKKPMDAMLVTLAGQLIAWPLALWLGVLIAKASGRGSYALKSFSPRLLPGLLLSGMGGALVLSYVVSLIPMSHSVRTAFSSLGNGNPYVYFAAITLVAPLTEELFFRGWMLRGFLRNYSSRNAILFTAIIFAVFHLNPWQGAVAFPLGLGLGWLVLRTGSLVPGMIVHFLYNLSTSYLIVPALILLGHHPDSIRQMNNLPMDMPAAGILLCALGFASIRQETRSRFDVAAPGHVADNLPAPAAESVD